jgi:hypothetical protein
MRDDGTVDTLLTSRFPQSSQPLFGFSKPPQAAVAPIDLSTRIASGRQRSGLANEAFEILKYFDTVGSRQAS